MIPYYTQNTYWCLKHNAMPGYVLTYLGIHFFVWGMQAVYFIWDRVFFGGHPLYIYFCLSVCVSVRVRHLLHLDVCPPYVINVRHFTLRCLSPLLKVRHFTLKCLSPLCVKCPSHYPQMSVPPLWQMSVTYYIQMSVPPFFQNVCHIWPSDVCPPCLQYVCHI